MLAATGQSDAAREQYAIVAADDFAALPFDTNWPSAMGELASACIELGDPELARPLYDRLLPYADRALTAGRAIASFGLDPAPARRPRRDPRPQRRGHPRLEEAVRHNEAAGFTVWADHARRALG